MMSDVGRRLAVVVAMVTALVACNGHLDFGVGAGTGGKGGVQGMAGFSGQGATGGTGSGGTGGAGTGGAGTGGAGTGGAGSCAVDGDCRLSTLHCDTGTKACVPCVGDMNCKDPVLHRCDLNLHRCVACVSGVSATGCATTESCLAGHCVRTCMDGVAPGCPTGSSCESQLCYACGDDVSGKCPSTPMTPFCLFPPRICVGCLISSDCGAAGAKSHCDPVSNACVECTTGADCPTGLPFCDPTTGSCTAG